jgi:nitrite reductase (NADH) large subunit
MITRVLMIGNGPATMSALGAIATHKATSKTDEFEITVISQEKTPAYAPMYLLGYLIGELRRENIMLGDGHGLSPKRLLGEKVIKIHDSKNKVVLGSGREIGYDRLLIASGASALMPTMIKGISKKGVHYFNRLDDVKRLSKEIPNTKTIIIIGAGVVGIEAAIAFNKMGKKVLVAELLDQILPQTLDKELARYFEKILSSLGITFSLAKGVSEITGNDRATGVVVGNKELRGDLILITAGVKPNVGFLKSSSVKLNTGIPVNEKMQTNVPDIYAAGDVAESLDPYGKYELAFNWYNAIDKGWAAGCNLAEAEYTYKASPCLAVLKGAEPFVTSVGRKYGDNGYEIISHIDKYRGIYQKVFIRDNRIDCYQAIGIPDKVALMYSFIKGRKDIRDLEDILVGNWGPAYLYY